MSSRLGGGIRVSFGLAALRVKCIPRRMNARFLSHVPPIKIVDLGAMSLGKGTEPYARLLAAGISCEIIGFEPVAEECAKLNASKAPGQTFLPYFIGDGNRHTFYESHFPAASSLFEPNMALLDKFQNLGNLTRAVRTSEVDTRRLDDIPEVVGTAFLKSDIQGAELMAFKAAERMLRDVVVIHTEVEFVPLYKNQPLFADIDLYLRSQGFAFHRFAYTMGRTMKPMVKDNNINATLSQTLWGDAIYVRDFMSFEKIPPAALLKLAAILHINYASFDLAAAALAAYDRQQSTDLFQDYINQFRRPAT